MDLFDIQDLSAPAAPAAGATSRVPGGVTDWSGAAQLEGLLEDMHGKVSTRTLDVSSGENASPRSESESRLFWLEETLGATVCGCVIGSKQSVHRFCISEVVGDTRACSIASHLKGAKVEAAAEAWYITTALRGKAGSRAALADKFIERTSVPKEFEESFESESREAEEWERLFVKATMAHLDIKVEEPKGRTLDLSAYYTPLKKKKNKGQPTSDGSDSWEGVQMNSPGAKLTKLEVDWVNSSASPIGRGVSTRRTFDTIQENFDSVEVTLDQQHGNLTGGLLEIQTRLNSLAMQVTSTDRRVGNPLGFGSEYGVTNAFDGIRHLCERIESIHDQFAHVPYSVMVERLVEIEGNLIGMEARQSPIDLIRDLEVKLDRARTETLGNFETLKNKFIGPVSSFFSKCTSGISIFDRLEALERGIHEVSSDGNVFASLKPMGGFSEQTGAEVGGPSYLKKMEGRMAELEAKNTDLQTKLSAMGPRQVNTTEQAPSNQLDLAPILKRLSMVEGAQGGYDSVTLGGYHFNGIADCEAFLRTEVPEFVRGAFGYDMVSLLHRASTGSMTTAEILTRDQNVKKGGFTNMGSAFIYTSMQQSLPGPFADPTTASMTSREPTPLPSLRIFGAWDKQDGQGGLRNTLYASNRHTVDTLVGLMNRELTDFPRALSVFTRMISDSEEHFRKLASFLTDTRNICFAQNGDDAESWEYPCRVVRGVFDECLKVRSVGSERSAVDQFTLKDASRTLWAALRCNKLMSEFVTSNFQGHPTLAGYSIQYLFKNRLTPKDLSGITAKVDAMRTEVKGVQAAQSKIKTKIGPS
jgi:hypothetical protein